jgi:formylglycine-generating enzyme required for sulfatase activity
MNRKYFLSLSALGIFALPLDALALSQTQKRVALVFANQNYENNPLPNIINDANAMEAALKQIGFTVTKGIDLSRSTMLAKLREFRAQIEAAPGCVALVYYSGHGAAVAGENYLIPIQNARLTGAEDLPDECVGLSRVLDTLGKSEGQLNLVILDACRDNPFPMASKSQGSKGLAVVARSLVGTLISFAASPGEVASANPSGANSLYTQELIRNLVRPGLRLEDVFIETRNAVVKKSGGTQLPREDGALQGQVFLAGRDGRKGDFEPESTVARLIFSGLPIGAVVSVDGKPVTSGTYEEDLSTASRKVSIEASAPGFRSMRGTTTLERGKALEVALALEPNPLSNSASSSKGKLATAASKARSGGCPQLAAYLEQLQLIPGGSFNMGSSDGDSDEKPVHRVTLTDFWLGRTLVPQELWAEYARVGGGSMPSAPSWGWLSNHPIVNVSWNDIQGFCTWASRVSGFELVLPSEAQWEYAARGGGKDVKWPWGNTFDSSKCVNGTNGKGRTAPVDRSDRVFAVRFSNGSELLDMSGNLWQWCSDWFGAYGPGSVTNPTGASSGTYKVLRGGSWNYSGAVNYRCAIRYNNNPTNADSFRGFRLLHPGL